MKLDKLHIYTLLIGLFTLASCSNDAKNSNDVNQSSVNTDNAKTQTFTINGSVKSGPKDGKVTLQKLINQKYATVDSTTLNGNKFVFEVKISEPEFYRVILFNKQGVNVLVTDKDLEIIADATVPEIPYTVKGSKDMDYYRTINRLVNKLGRETQQLNSEYVLARKSEDDRAKEIFKKLIDLQKDGIKKVKGIIDTIQPSIAALYAANVLNPDEEYPYLKKLSDNLVKKYPNSRYVRRNAEFLKSISAWTVGQPAPELALNSPEGKEISLSSLKGKLVLIDFWASWCKPCRMENPNVVKVYNEFKNRGFEILGVSLDRDKTKWVQAIKDDGLPWLHISDLKMWQSSAAAKYNVRAIPMTYLIDKEGKILAKNLRGPALKERIAQELN